MQSCGDLSAQPATDPVANNASTDRLSDDQPDLGGNCTVSSSIYVLVEHERSATCTRSGSHCSSEITGARHPVG